MSAPTRYIETAYVSEYFLEVYGAVPAEWSALTTDQKDRTTVQVSIWMDHQFGARWQGTRATKDQVRDHPRLGMIDRDGYAIDPTTTHVSVRRACAEACVLSAKGLLTSVPDTTSGGSIKSESFGGRGGSYSVVYSGAKREDTSVGRSFPKLEAMLRDVLVGGGGGTVEHVVTM